MKRDNNEIEKKEEQEENKRVMRDGDEKLNSDLAEMVKEFAKDILVVSEEEMKDFEPDVVVEFPVWNSIMVQNQSKKTISAEIDVPVLYGMKRIDFGLYSYDGFMIEEIEEREKEYFEKEIGGEVFPLSLKDLRGGVCSMKWVAGGYGVWGDHLLDDIRKFRACFTKKVSGNEELLEGKGMRAKDTYKSWYRGLTEPFRFTKDEREVQEVDFGRKEYFINGFRGYSIERTFCWEFRNLGSAKDNLMIKFMERCKKDQLLTELSRLALMILKKKFKFSHLVRLQIMVQLFNCGPFDEEPLPRMGHPDKQNISCLRSEPLYWEYDFDLAALHTHPTVTLELPNVNKVNRLVDFLKVTGQDVIIRLDHFICANFSEVGCDKDFTKRKNHGFWHSGFTNVMLEALSTTQGTEETDVPIAGPLMKGGEDWSFSYILKGNLVNFPQVPIVIPIIQVNKCFYTTSHVLRALRRNFGCKNTGKYRRALKKEKKIMRVAPMLNVREKQEEVEKETGKEWDIKEMHNFEDYAAMWEMVILLCRNVYTDHVGMTDAQRRGGFVVFDREVWCRTLGLSPDSFVVVNMHSWMKSWENTEVFKQTLEEWRFENLRLGYTKRFNVNNYTKEWFTENFKPEFSSCEMAFDVFYKEINTDTDCWHITDVSVFNEVMRGVRNCIEVDYKYEEGYRNIQGLMDCRSELLEFIQTPTIGKLKKYKEVLRLKGLICDKSKIISRN